MSNKKRNKFSFRRYKIVQNRQGEWHKLLVIDTKVSSDAVLGTHCSLGSTTIIVWRHNLCHTHHSERRKKTE